MRQLMAFFTALIVASPLSGFCSDLGSLRMSHIEGDVQINSNDTGEWYPASENMPLRPGDRLWVPDNGRAEIQSLGGTFIRLDRNTAADVLRVEGSSSQLNINSGAAYVNFSGRDDLVQIDTPVSSVRIDDRAKVNIEVAEDGDTSVAVVRGKAAVEDRMGVTDVREGDELVMERNRGVRLYSLPAPDDWDRWNSARDRIYSSSSMSSRYLPADLTAYGHDLDSNGRWVDVQDYGWVWTPRVAGRDWAPYRSGRWVWIDGDYVWVSYESWGWAPYHYGRWAYSPAVGWFWVPPKRGYVYWGPGYVGWVRTSTYVSWVPLAPGEIYYGRGYYGPHSVNVTNVNVNISKTVNVYKNVYVNNSVTAVNHQSFVSGDYRRVNIRNEEIMHERISAGGPNIAPGRTSRMPLVKQISIDRRPPARIRDISIERMKVDRKLERDNNRSVMHNGAVQQMKKIDMVGRPFDRNELGKDRRQPGGNNRPEIITNRSLKPEPSVKKDSPVRGPAFKQQPPRLDGPTITRDSRAPGHENTSIIRPDSRTLGGVKERSFDKKPERGQNASVPRDLPPRNMATTQNGRPSHVDKGRINAAPQNPAQHQPIVKDERPGRVKVAPPAQRADSAPAGDHKNKGQEIKNKGNGKEEIHKDRRQMFQNQNSN